MPKKLFQVQMVVCGLNGRFYLLLINPRSCSREFIGEEDLQVLMYTRLHK